VPDGVERAFARELAGSTVPQRTSNLACPTPRNFATTATAPACGAIGGAQRDLNDDSECRQIDDEIAQACGRLKASGHTRVVVRGAMRLPAWFATGAHLRHTHGASIALLQRGVIWSSNDAVPSVGLRTTTSHHLGVGDDIAVAVVRPHVLRGRQAVSLTTMIAVIWALDRVELLPAPSSLTDRSV